MMILPDFTWMDWNFELRKSVFSLIHTKSFRVRPRKLTWNPKIGGLQMRFLFQRGILSFHVNFRVYVYMSAIFVRNPPRIPVNARMTYISFLAKHLGIWYKTVTFSLYMTSEKPYLGGETSNIFYFHPEPWGNDPVWLFFFQMGWFNHQPARWCSDSNIFLIFYPDLWGFHDLQFGTTKNRICFQMAWWVFHHQNSWPPVGLGSQARLGQHPIAVPRSNGP